MDDIEHPENRCKSLRKRLKTVTLSDQTSVKDVLTAAERAKRYREAMKKNPKKYSHYLQKERERKRLSWRSRTEEQILEDRRKARERQKRFCQKRKMMGFVPAAGKSSEKKAVLTRSEREKQREYWRRKQAESRARRSSQKHRRCKEKDRMYHEEIRKNSETEPRISRKKQVMPRDPQEFVSEIENIINSATPRKKELMKQKNLLNTPKSRKKLLFYENSSNIMKSVLKGNSEVKKKIIRNLSFLKKYRLNRTFSTFLGVSDSYINKHSGVEQKKQPRTDAICEEHKKTVQDFFNRADMSTNLPVAKRVKRDMQERRVFDRPLTDVYKEFQEHHPDIKASFSTFVRNKPKNVESTRKQPWYGCLCDSCTNIELKLKALNKVAEKHRSDIKVRDKYEAVALTLCKKEGAAYHKLKCVQRQCSNCSCDNIVRFYQPLAEEGAMDLVSYSKWECGKKIYKGKEVTQIMPVPRRESLTQLIVNLSKELENFAEHLFVAAWQQNQFSWIQKNVPKSWVFLNMDFAENYSCVAQQEVQSAHWSHNQVTIHPTVAYYRCQEEGCEDIVMEHLIFVSDDKTHDAAAVNKFVMLANEHLKEVRGLNIEREIQLTDGCAAQYKSRVPFTDILQSE